MGEVVIPGAKCEHCGAGFTAYVEYLGDGVVTRARYFAECPNCHEDTHGCMAPLGSGFPDRVLRTALPDLSAEQA